MAIKISKTDAIDLANKTLRTFEQVQGNSGGAGGKNAFYGSVDTYGAVKSQSYPCHAYMRYNTNSFVVFSKYVLAQKSKSVADHYLKFLQTGPWSALFDRFYYDDTVKGFINPYPNKTPANFQHNFLVASRSISEWSHEIFNWDLLVYKYKIHPAVAYWFLCLFNVGTQFPSEGEKSTLVKCIKYDWPLDVQTYPDTAFFKFVQGKPEHFNHMYSTNPQYTPVNAIWGPNVKYDLSYPFLLSQRYGKTTGKHINKTTKVYTSEVLQGDWMNSIWQVTYEELLTIIRAEEKRVLG